MSTIQMTGIPMARTAAPPAQAPVQAQPVQAQAVQQQAPPVAYEAAPQAAPPAMPAPPPASSAPWREEAPPKKLPNWLGFLIAFAIVGSIAATVAWYTTQRQKGSATVAPEVKKDAVVSNHPYARDLEIAGFRLTNLTKSKQQVQFLIINHGGTDMSDLGGIITVRGRGTAPDAEPAFTFKFSVKNLPPYSAKEIEVREFLQIKKSMIDMPDWQFFEPKLEITSPAN
jgi:hypothetical protein